MKPLKHGGPAFPCDFTTEAPSGISATLAFVKASTAGMTLRDYFAAKALQALLHPGGRHSFDATVKLSYGIADAMLAEREK